MSSKKPWSRYRQMYRAIRHLKAFAHTVVRIHAGVTDGGIGGFGIFLHMETG